MRSFSNLNAVIISLVFCVACSEQEQAGFFNSHNINQSNQIEFQDIHQLKLTISELHKEIDESGFSPKLKSRFLLSNLQENQWPQAWVVFKIKILLKDLEILSITQSQALQNHQLAVSFQQDLPNFGIDKDQLSIRVTPIAWMPTFPLHFLDQPPTDVPSTNQPLSSASSPLPSLSIHY